MTITYGDFGEYSDLNKRDCPVPAADQPGNILEPTSKKATDAWCDCMYAGTELQAKCKEYGAGYPWTITGKLSRVLPQDFKAWLNAWHQARDTFAPPPVQPAAPPPKKTYNTGGSSLGAASGGLMLVGAAILGYVLLKK